MKKELLIGLAIGFGLAFAWNKMKAKDCGCGQGDIDAEDAPIKEKAGADEKEMTCDEAVTKLMSTMKFGSREAMKAFRQKEMAKCQATL